MWDSLQDALEAAWLMGISVRTSPSSGEDGEDTFQGTEREDKHINSFSQEDVFHELGSLQVRGQDSGPALIQQDGQDGLAQVSPVQLRAQRRHLGPNVH